MISLDEKDFNEKFEKLISILVSNSEIFEKFAEILTIEDSYPLACSLVGEMDFDMYENAVRKYVNGSDSDNNGSNIDLSSVSGGSNPFSFKSFIDKLK